MLSKFPVILHVERGEWRSIGQAAGGHPRIILRARSAAAIGGSGEFAPHRGDVIGAVQHRDSVQPPGQPLLPQAAPLPPDSPLGQLALMNVIEGSWPSSRESSGGGSERRKLRDATSVSRMIRLTHYAKSARRAA